MFTIEIERERERVLPSEDCYLGKMIVLSVLTAVAGGVVKQVVSLAGDQLRLDIVWDSGGSKKN